MHQNSNHSSTLPHYPTLAAEQRTLPSVTIAAGTLQALIDVLAEGRDLATYRNLTPGLLDRHADRCAAALRSIVAGGVAP